MSPIPCSTVEQPFLKLCLFLVPPLRDLRSNFARSYDSFCDWGDDDNRCFFIFYQLSPFLVGLFFSFSYVGVLSVELLGLPSFRSLSLPVPGTLFTFDPAVRDHPLSVPCSAEPV